MKKVKVIQKVFLMKITNDEYKSMVLHEGAGKEWFSINDARKLNMYSSNQKIIDDFEKKNKIDIGIV